MNALSLPFSSQLDHISGLPADGQGWEKITAAFDQAAFSSMPDHSFRRYIDHHLTGIVRLSENTKGKERRAVLLNLTDHLLNYSPDFILSDVVAPLAYQIRLVKKLSQQINALTTYLENHQPSGYNCLLDYLTTISESEANARFSFCALAYFEHWANTLFNCVPNGCIAEALLKLNFNQLGYLAALQQAVPLTRESLLFEKKRVLAIPEPRNFIYHPDWPPLRQMLIGWLDEQLALLPEEICCQDKLTLDFSVAQLACVLRLVQDEGLLKGISLSRLFPFITRCFSAKRQCDISVRSLSKEYYSTTQVTAATVRAVLLNLVARINRNFFPVLIAAGAISLVV